jgi:hypothetical protein
MANSAAFSARFSDVRPSKSVSLGLAQINSFGVRITAAAYAPVVRHVSVQARFLLIIFNADP